MRSLFRSFVIAAGFVAAVQAFAQADPPTVSFKLDAPTAAANKPLHGVITLTFAEGLHGYQNPPTDPLLIPVSVTVGDKTFSIVKVEYPKGVPTKIDGEDKPVNIYVGTIKIPVTLKAPSKLGKSTLKLSIGYQQCNAQSCFPPSSVAVQTVVSVVKSTATPKSKDND